MATKQAPELWSNDSKSLGKAAVVEVNGGKWSIIKDGVSQVLTKKAEELREHGGVIFISPVKKQN